MEKINKITAFENLKIIKANELDDEKDEEIEFNKLINNKCFNEIDEIFNTQKSKNKNELKELLQKQLTSIKFHINNKSKKSKIKKIRSEKYYTSSMKKSKSKKFRSI